jgi:hypothetical protein
MSELTQIIGAFIVMGTIAVALRFMFPAPPPREDTRERFDSGTTIANSKAIGSVIVDRGTYVVIEYRDGRKLNVLPEQVTQIRLK